ncbi:gephyrin-like molybdotransferase Glp [Polyangium aurulentum]|uniref:molybdopterin molybdotransferase MoeA n=1 Tax=Polyangium aurulentum TaxID=2567896 RepID=UPI0010AE0DE0|nr:gephyrin-like molybdotransferase Glp [Polyangium aurulentum]UQA62100.1 molybdopterin molybdotransferase MoeA [Polyangium aurulentum]
MRDVRMRGFRQRKSVEEALRALEERTALLEPERVKVTEASGRVLAEDVAAASAVPHFRRAAMDGWAVVGESTFGAGSYAPVEIAIIGEARPGRPFAGSLRKGEAVRITTGAPVPEGADAVLMAERAEEVTEEGRTLLRVAEPVAPGKHVGAVGEDVPEGAIVATRGRKLRPQDVGLLASVGVAEISVVRRPRVRIVITGDELLAPGSMPSGACIVDSNSVVLTALVRRDGAASVSTVRAVDRYEEVRDAIGGGDEDVVLVSGGSSVGPEDHAPLALAEIGEVTVHGVAMRPSSPAGFGFVPRDGRLRPVFLLPGNPVSCLCAYEFFGGPTIRAMGGLPRAWPHPRVKARLAAKIVSELGRMDYVRVKLQGDLVTPIMTSGASILSSTTRADGVVLVPAGLEGHAEGEEVEVFLYD